MSDSTTKRVRVPKPEKKKASELTASANSTDTTIAAVETTLTDDDALINIPAVKKKKERRVKTEADIAAKQERKQLRKEAEQAKKEAQLAKKGLATTISAIQNKTPKWKQFLKNTTEADNAEQLKDTSYKVKGDDGSGDDSESDNDVEEKKGKKSKRKADKDVKDSSSKSKKSKKDDNTKLATLDTSTPGLAYLVEWKRSKSTWKFQKMRQVWLLNNMYNDKQIPSTHWDIFLEYIRELKGAARNAAIQDAKNIVEAPEPEEEEETKGEDQEMKEADAEELTESTIPLSEEEKAAEEAAKEAKVEETRAAEVKSSRALDVLRVLA